MAKILVLDDDAILNKNIGLALQTAGYTVLSAATIAEAEALYADADLLLLDVMLPDGNGVEFCRRIRAYCEVPILFLTSNDDEADIIKGLESGGDDYITKPFRLRELLSRIGANLRRCAVTPPTALPELTAVEQKLLEYLMWNKGRYLTREQILAFLWDSKGCFVNDNTLSVHISRLRDKLKTADCGRIITKRGLGYQWTDST
ncbi:MAG: response regulator transcription factor [Oscillospiraceae bacterium]|nr:response regulator transcription factor [Oscillospiraceae bacterium]